MRDFFFSFYKVLKYCNVLSRIQVENHIYGPSAEGLNVYRGMKSVLADVDLIQIFRPGTPLCYNLINKEIINRV